MKKGSLVFLLCFIAGILPAQIILPAFADSLFSPYYHQRRTLFESMPETTGEIVFIGNSITDGGEWGELFGDLQIRNRGISGDITTGVIRRLKDIVSRKPAKIFLLIGINDLARSSTPDSVAKNIFLITDYVREKSPSTRLFIQSILPVSNRFGKFPGHTRLGQEILQLNRVLQNEAGSHRYTYIDLHSFFADREGKLHRALTNDGLHLSGAGYLLWKHLVFPRVYGLQDKPSLLPMPQQVNWQPGFFRLNQCRKIVVTNKGFASGAKALQSILAGFGWEVEIGDRADSAGIRIELREGQVDAPLQKDEAYRLEVREDIVRITASSPHGIHNGIQTLRQLLRDGVMADACEITDWPAFAWRGYMIDAGRNYVSMALLKQQIDVMAAYKLNVFHFHATEDIAWRLESKLFPQLTAPEHMLRNKGQYYSVEEIRDLIEYCRDRHILFVPEIDMPGHSAAFTRAMGTDMQRDTGLVYVKQILGEFLKTFDVSYLHIGADEVRITNQKFIPEVSAFIEGFGKKIIGWQPGGNFGEQTIRQLWMDDLGKISGNNRIRFIDSRHLYLNHMDPLESVVTIFNRRISDRLMGDSLALGATLCTWHDRTVSDDQDIIRMNPVYPGMLAFAERSWLGGGKKGWVAHISDGDSLSFVGFERRLSDQKAQYFKQLPFPYRKQWELSWDLFGPYRNNGDLGKAFEPEKRPGGIDALKPALKIRGGTIILRHWWAPLIQGAIPDPADSTTWYAFTRIWRDEAGVSDFWIGFNDISRSQASDSPPEHAWDKKGSAIWVNGKLIPPPAWRRAGQTGNAEVPLADEGYAFRTPTRIFLERGWNEILVKCPVGSFKGKDWQNPVKWMFTCMPLDD